ncbi:ribbon-helix-helix domain-containing protein [Kitasatospora sp. MAP5-34]|uniref:ribbon-helix-helix domain-containing protein n=1 Tax=Kitasatospora sp. MAP5-34 TaxID=3035102 RepID=UPI0024733ADD|nr:ribbon-helix-helix domain-containing protein [Kitasatospora sp. MAP5-34]MDH6577509.1 Arc/MetJ-type ribon-helix-helix transcriptional regulator [Kitasatospora sp. MAP5-34]
MKISVSLPEGDVAFLDQYAAETSTDSRSAVIHAAIELLRASQLEDDYAKAWQDWEQNEDAAIWDRATGDGLSDATR